MNKQFSQSIRIQKAPTVHTSATLTTSPVKVTLPAGVYGSQTNVKLINLHASNLIAFTVVDAGAAAPTVNATLADANCGAIIRPASEVELLLDAGQDLYVVASAASTTFASFSVVN
jgi:hypothetical protein